MIGVKISRLKWFQILLTKEEQGAFADENWSQKKMGSPNSGLPNKLQ